MDRSSLLFIRAFFASLLLCSLLIPAPLRAQKYYTAETSSAIKLGRTKPLYDIISLAPTDSAKLKERKLNKPTFVPNFSGRRHLLVHNPDALPKGADPLYRPAELRTPPVKIEPKVVIEGINQSNVNSGVPDVNGDIGRDYFVEIVNATHFRVYNKNGQAVSNLISANSIWGQVQQSSAGDPIILYDQLADRWFLTEFPSNNRVLLAVSVTNDPRGSWDAYAFQTPRFPDFPKYGIWPDAFYLTTNENGANFPIYAFNREDLLAGIDTIRFQRLTVPKNGGVFFEVGQPVDWDGMTPPPSGSPGLVVKMLDDDWGTTSIDQILLHKIHIDWDTAANSNIELIQVPTAPFDSDGCSLENTGGFSCIPQPNFQGIDGAQWIITNKAQYRNFGTHESFVLSFMVDINGNDVAGIRWMEFRKDAQQDWHIHQEGTVGSEDGLHRFMSSIGIDGQGNIGLAYSVSGYDKHPSLRFTGRYASDPPGEMTFEEYEFATGSGSIGFDRFGDYASMSVDPADDRTFWFAGEYVRSNGSWGTKIVAFDASKDTFDIFPIELITPQNHPGLGTDESLTFTVLNRGLKTVHDFSIGYQFMDGAWIIEEASVDSLQPDSIYEHTFQTDIDFGLPGSYNLRLATSLGNDQNLLNDTLSFVIVKPAYRDVVIEYDGAGQPEIVCSDIVQNNIQVRNLGADTVLKIDFETTLNASVVDTIHWEGVITTNEEVSIVLEIPGLIDGPNQLSVKVIAVNDQSDENPVNDFANWDLTAKPSGEGLFFNLTTDNFPQETTWQLVDSENNIIVSDGPFAEQQHTYTTYLCLDPDECYTLTIFDGFGDGMSAQGINGDFQLTDHEGTVIASLADPDFGATDVTEFCVSGACLLDLHVGVVHESGNGANDGVAVVEVSNAVGAPLFSIDGGVNFQAENTFTNLGAGIYTLIVKDNAGCTDSVEFQIHACHIETLITTKPATGGDVGEIQITATGGVGQLSYSINGGAFAIDSIFTGLGAGEYIVVTRDSVGCESIDTVTISTEVGTTFIRDNSFIQLYPNPGRGVYQVNSMIKLEEIFIPFSIYSVNGDYVLQGTLVKYNDRHKGEISLVNYADGIYFAAFYIGESIAVKRIIKNSKG